MVWMQGAGLDVQHRTSAQKQGDPLPCWLMQEFHPCPLCAWHCAGAQGRLTEAELKHRFMFS